MIEGMRIPKSAYVRLQKLGEVKFQKIVNELARGQSVPAVARMVQMDWHELQDVSERTLVQQLNRFRTDLSRGEFGVSVEVVDEEGKTDLRRLKGKHVDVVEDLVGLIKMQRSRVQMFWEKEQELKMPVPGMEAAIEGYKKLLLDTQKVKFDLGMDEFKGVIPGMKITQTSASDGQGRLVHQQVIEAVGRAEAIFDRYLVPHVAIPLDGTAT